MKLFLTFIFIAFASNTFAQYKNIDVTPVVKQEKVVTYDTTANICFQNNPKEYVQYIGQEIIFYECASNYTPPSRIYGNFILTTPDTIWHKIRKKPRRSDYTLIETYKGKYFSEGVVCFGNNSRKNNKKIIPEVQKYYETSKEIKPDYFTPASEIEGKKFKILNIETEHSYWEKNLRLTLLSKTGDTLLWNLPDNSVEGYAFPCIISSYCQHMEQSYVGKTFIIERDRYDRDKIYKAIDTKNGERVTVSDTLTCTSLSFVGLKKNYRIPCLIFKGNNNNEFAVRVTKTPHASFYLDESRSSLYSGDWDKDDLRLYQLKDLKIIQEEERQARLKAEEKRKQEQLEAEQKRKQERQQELAREKKRQAEWAAKEKRCINKFGKSWAEVIMQGKVSIGMTKEMCREAWGNPDDINITQGSWGVNEQWVYGYSSFLYFENGKLTTIQN